MFFKKQHEETKTYVIDELTKRSTWIYLSGYFCGMLLFAHIFNPPEWVLLFLLMGFVWLGTKLIWLKMLRSDYNKPNSPEIESEASTVDGNKQDGE